MKTLRFIILCFVVWRLFLFLPLLLGSEYLAYRKGYEYTNLWKFTKPYNIVSSHLLYPWANFDGVHYLSIAANGYSHNERFFPLYPLLTRLLSLNLSQPFGGAYFFSALAISNVSFLLSLTIFYKLLRLDYSRSVAKTSTLLLLVFPTSFFFAATYAESLFFFLTVLSFYVARKRYWFTASIVAMLVSATRIVGVVMLLSLLVEFLRHERNRRRILSLGLVPLGLLAYMVFSHLRFGNSLQFLLNQQEVANSRTLLVFPLQTLVRYAKIFLTLPIDKFEWWVALLEITTFVFVGYLLYAAYRRGVRFSYVVFAVFSFLIPVFSGTFSGLPRYTAVLFPIFIALALSKNVRLRIGYAIVSIVLLFLLLMAFSRGYYVG